MRASLFIFVISIGYAAAPVRDFDHRVSDYVKLHKKLEAQLPRLKSTDSAEAITSHQKELSGKIHEARNAAKPREIFTPEISAEFRRLIAHGMRGHRAQQVQRSLQHAEPVQVALRINEPYPDNLPLQSMPPTLLQHLPKLPPEVDYRIAANLIVDFIPDAIP